MTIETKNTLQPGAYGFNSKAGDYEIVAFYWVEGAQVFVTSEHRKKKKAPERAFFAVGKAPKIELINLRVVGHKTKTAFKVHLVTNDAYDEPVPFMSNEELLELGKVLAIHLANATGLKCDPVQPALFDHG